MLTSIISWMTVIGVLQVNGHNSSDHGFHRCGSDEMLEYALSQDPDMQGRMDAIEEHWRENPNYDGHQVDFRRRLQSLPSPIEIPINFLITKGPSDPYIGYEQIISQIRVLNQDFQGSNPDKGQNGRGSASEFSGLAGNFNLRFSLNKIKRQPTLQQGFTRPDMKSYSKGGQDNEDPEHALNIWVNALTDPNLLGFGTFPGGDWNHDGVVIKSTAFGSHDYDRNNKWSLMDNHNKGRTATHEIGHWLNLHHIFGNGDCTHDDFVSDTPVDDDENFGCPADGTSSCGSHDMYMNYMDYTNDNCKNMFTIGQVDRGDDLFLAGGHREKLLDYVSNPTDTRFVDYFYFVTGNGAQCDDGHTRRDVDLNKGAGGHYIYLCISYSNNPHVDVITGIYILSGSRGDFPCLSGYEKIDTDLNEDAGGDYIHICYMKEPRLETKKVITDLMPFIANSAEWARIFWGPLGWKIIDADLNKAAGGDDIWLGYMEDHVFESINFGQVKSGSITANKKQYYKLTLSEAESISFETCGSDLDTYLYFYDSNFNLLHSCNDCNKQGPDCRYQGDLTVSTASAGTYYVAVGGHSSNHGSFQLSMTHGSLSCGGSVTGDIVSFGKDYYRIDLDKNYHQIFIKSCNPGTDYDSMLYLYNHTMEQIALCDDCHNHNEDCGHKADLIRDNINAGTYYVGIGGYNSYSGHYELTLTCNTATSAGVDFVKDIDNDNNNNPVYRYKNKYFIIELSNNDILMIIFVLLLLLMILCIMTYKNCMIHDTKRNRYNPVKMISDSEIDAEAQQIANLN